MKNSLSIVISSTLLLNGCANMQPISQSVSNTFASDDPCSNNARNIGIATGAVVGTGLGILLSKATGGDSKKAILTGAVLGAGAAAATGWFIGKNIDQRRCELHKIAERYHIRLQAIPIEVAGHKEPIGLAIALPEETQGGHFASGTDVLSTSARKYFSDIARQYSVSVQLASLPNNATDNEKQAIRKQLSDKKILLVGHTDDSGDSANNAELSERRARAVASLFREAGVPETNLLYQGAGETLPVGDNNSAAGRQSNRRVEIIDVNDENALQIYLASRRPNLAFYRIETDNLPGNGIASHPDQPAKPSATDSSDTAAPITTAKAPPKKRIIVASKTPSNKVEAAIPPVISNSLPKATSTTTTARPTNKPATIATTSSPLPVKSSTAATTATPEIINFGGKPATDGNAVLSIGKPVSTSGFSLISKAYASDPVVLHSCHRDRPRISGNIKQLKDGKVYAKNEHLPGLYGTSWADKVNGHLVVLNQVSLLRDSAQADVLPLVNIYKDYDPSKDRNPRPTLSFTPQVNTYRGDKGILYRMFAGSGKNLQCLDVLLPINGGREAQSGLIVYGSRDRTLIAPFQPKSL